VSDPREEIWGKAFYSYLATRIHPTEARMKADEALEEHESRWPAAVAAPVVVAGLDGAMLQRAITQLNADGRWDAKLVLSSLFEAVMDAQVRGDKLSKWTPPPRGGG
jgi:hypothetical protein